jgi:hypothetical protein
MEEQKLTEFSGNCDCVCSHWKKIEIVAISALILCHILATYQPKINIETNTSYQAGMKKNKSSQYQYKTGINFKKKCQ